MSNNYWLSAARRPSTGKMKTYEKTKRIDVQIRLKIIARIELIKDEKYDLLFKIKNNLYF